MNYPTKINLSFLSAIIASLCWVTGDILIAGFNVNPKDYPLFSEVYADKVDPGIAMLMLQGSTERLMAGALIAAMTASLFLPGIWLAFQFVKDKTKWYAYITYFILILSVMLMPLGHAVFFFTGEIYKAIYHTDASAHPYLLETAAGFMKVFYITWAPAIIILFIGWLLYSLLVFMKKTVLPRWAGFISPVFLTLYQQPIKLLMPSSELKSWVNAAGFNISYLVFFLLLLVLFRNKLLARKE
ncbi:DUF6796 family protein [Apibacter sp. HY039]|uniref:DUF6796 family protein n=1 Tax=Apibacter sp. HY039 TaxID=2501476 RepID=UPI000FEB7A25|nr:DUF6796 family protein [Apibacter sp. HY039]